MVRIPGATYRMQLHSGFGFADAERLVPYLDLLGITDLYTSPILTARPGSTIGSDLVDFSKIGPELGGLEALERLSRTLRDRGMGMLVDHLADRMCIATPHNAWWVDVLENGPSSPEGEAFDIDWKSPHPRLINRLLLPILLGPYGEVLAAGELQVRLQLGGFWLCYREHQLPLGSRTWTHMLEPARAWLQSRGETSAANELRGLLAQVREIPYRDGTPAEVGLERQRKKLEVRARLTALLEARAEVGEAIAAALSKLNGKVGDPGSFDELDALLEEQAYRVAHWRLASEEINYRRFRDKNDLAALRVEKPQIFEKVHAVVLDLVRRGVVTGLRIDSVDGLLDPLGYLRQVQAACAASHPPVADGKNIYLVVEKVLAEGEALPPAWPVHGTTGYDFLHQVGGVFIDRQGSRVVHEHYVRLTHQPRVFADIAYECKKLALWRGQASQVAMLSRRLFAISDQKRETRDLTSRDLADALVEFIACLRVYRTYLGTSGGLDEQDAHRVDEALAEARRRAPALPGSVFEFLRAVLVLDHPPGLTEAQREARRAFTLSVQQLTAGVAVSALEDTAFYRFYPLSSNGELGGEPEFPGVPIETLHQHSQTRAERNPHGILSTSTHDTRRGEDVRARIRLLSEVPAVWAAAFERFHELNQRHRLALPEGHAPDENEEYLFYQTLLGVWPFEPLTRDSRAELVLRLRRYMLKMLREAKVHSSWVSPHERWEQAVSGFVEAVLLPATAGEFLGAFQRFAEPLLRASVWSSLAQVLLKVGSPGVPDFFQGCELWDLNLMEPDNRRAVDFALRERLLKSLIAEAQRDAPALLEQLTRAPGDGRLKLYVTHRALVARRSNREVFERGRYEPLQALGPQAGRVIAFERAHGKKSFLVVVPRFLIALASRERVPVGEEAWAKTMLWLPHGREDRAYRDAFSGKTLTSEQGSLPLAQVFGALPAALLESTP